MAQTPKPISNIDEQRIFLASNSLNYPPSNEELNSKLLDAKIRLKKKELNDEDREFLQQIVYLYKESSQLLKLRILLPPKSTVKIDLPSFCLDPHMAPPVQKTDYYLSARKELLKQIDENAILKLPSHAKDLVTDLVRNTVSEVPEVRDAGISLDLATGQYHDFKDFKKSLMARINSGDTTDVSNVFQVNKGGRSVFRNHQL